MNGKHYALLLKKQFLDALPTKKRKGKFVSNWASGLLMALLIGVMIAVFVLIFSRFIDTYSAIKINRVSDIEARQFEIMSTAYFILIVAFVFSGVSSLSHTLFENSDLNLLISMPFSGTEIFLSKLTWVFLKQAAIALVAVPVVNFTFLCVTNTLNVYNGIMTFVVAIALPILPLGVASIVVLPFYFIKRIINSHYLLVFTVMTLIMAGFAVAYSYIFEMAEGLLTTDKITSLFNENVMTAIRNFTAYNYPANLYAYLVLGRDVGKNIGILAAISIISAIICLAMINAVFIRVSHTTLSFHIPHLRRKKAISIRKSRFASLLIKEFLLVMRTPNYAYMYFTTAVIMPIMAYYSAKISMSVLSSMLGSVDVTFEVCTFVIFLYSTLTNTFCSTNISRDGYMSMMQKTLPYRPSQILGAKMVFCALISELTVAIACIVLGATHLESALNAVITFIASSLLVFAQIIVATRMDLHRPHFSKSEDGEIKEANSTVSIIISLGLGVSFVIGAGLLFNALKALLAKQTYIGTDRTMSYIIAICVPLALLGGAIIYFFANLKKDYANLDAEG